MSNKTNLTLENLNLPIKYKSVISFLTDKICDNEDVQKIYLFGSCATETTKNSSDVDLAVVVDDRKTVDRDFRLSIIDNIEDAFMRERLFLPNIPYDIVFFNNHDFERNKTVSISVVRDIVKVGKLLYER
ncbi:MAG: nucleotidyltransferase domain-containing protein [Oscillospiraceae bacterium]|nr:nucleotidyltransferase domain-containing protein [Oscillospiraceae bacterium]